MLTIVTLFAFLQVIGMALPVSTSLKILAALHGYQKQIFMLSVRFQVCNCGIVNLKIKHGFHQSAMSYTEHPPNVEQNSMSPASNTPSR